MLQSLFRPVLRPIMMGVMSVTGSRRAWSPADLASLGAWFDPSDLSTMFNDSAGTTPVAVPGTVADSANPVGLIQDKSVNDRHASQSTSTARPLLSARVNLLTHTEDFADTSWSMVEVTRTQNVVVAPDGTTTASLAVPTTVSENHRVRYSTNTAVPTAGVYSIYVKSAGYLKVGLREDEATGALAAFDLASGGSVIATSGAAVSSPVIEAVGNDWYRISATFSGVNPLRYAVCVLPPAYTSGSAPSWAANGTDGVYIWGAQLELGSTATPYQRVTTDSDYDGDPAKFPYYLSFDGVDDYLSTSAFTTVPQPITYFVGVNPTTKPLVGHITDGSATGREFIIFGNSTVEVNAGTTQAAGDYFAATSQINTMVFNGALSAWNRNGGSFTTINPGTQGIDRLFIGANYLGGNTLKGNLYQLIFGAAVYGAPTILEAETWVAEKTGVTL